MNQTPESPVLVNVLNRLLETLYRSLALYVEEVRPWGLADHEPVWTAIRRLAADCRTYGQRVAEAILDRGGQPDPGTYPPQFAALNDVGLEFFLREIIVRLKQDQAVACECAEELAGDAALHALAEEVCGNLRGHTELLEKLATD